MPEIVEKYWCYRGSGYFLKSKKIACYMVLPPISADRHIRGPGTDKVRKTAKNMGLTKSFIGIAECNLFFSVYFEIGRDVHKRKAFLDWLVAESSLSRRLS